jgi:hypothetical protein
VGPKCISTVPAFTRVITKGMKLPTSVSGTLAQRPSNAFGELIEDSTFIRVF